jgi:Thiamine monophosphate kinase
MHKFNFLRHIFKSNTKLPTHILLPPNDNITILTIHNTSKLLVTTNNIIKNHHTPLKINPTILEHKTILHNLSDVTTITNTQPITTITTTIVPHTLSQEQLWHLYKNLHNTTTQ